MHFDWLQKIMLWLIPLIFAITVHEVAHGWVASKCGDQTAKMLGRLTLNPVKHVDPVGTIIVPMILLLLPGHFMFGWAKPVPVDWRNLRKPRPHMALVAAAGPIANLIMALLWGVVAKIGVMISAQYPWPGMILGAMGAAGVLLNLMLGLLNLIPLPPLDGSRILSSCLSAKAAWRYNQIERWGFVILIILMMTGFLSGILIPILSILVYWISLLLGVDIAGLSLLL